MEFQSSEQEKITGVKRNRLQQWLERGWIKPSKPAEGHGTRNIYSIEDLYKIVLFRKITESGIQRKRAAKLLEMVNEPHFRSKGLASWADVDYVLFFRISETDGVRGNFISVIGKFEGWPGREWQRTNIKYYEQAHMFNVRQLRQEVDRKIKELER